MEKCEKCGKVGETKQWVDNCSDHVWLCPSCYEYEQKYFTYEIGQRE